MASVQEMIALADFYTQKKQEQNPLFALAKGIDEGLKRRQALQQQQQNIDANMKNAKQMMEAMAGMENKSSSGKASQIVDDSKETSRRGVVDSSTMIPTREFTMDESGVPSMKIGMKNASPAEQKALMDAQKMRIDEARAEDLRQAALGYIEGSVPEAILASKIIENGGNPDDMAKFRSMKAIRESQMQNISQWKDAITGGQIPDGYRPKYEVDKISGQNKVSGYEPIPVSEVKAQRDMAREDKADAIKSQNTIDSANRVISSIDHLEKNINYFGGLEGRVAPVFPGKIEFNKNYQYLKANNILNVLSEMKSQSRTGATGFGALNEKELGIIENASMKLDVTMDEKTAKKYLDEMKTAFQKIIDREQNGYDFERNGQGNQGQQTEVAPREALIAEAKRRGLIK